MNLNLKNKIALVTGGSRGIGASICRGLAAEGVRVGVNYSASAEKAEAVAEAIRRDFGVDAVAIKGNLEVETDIVALLMRLKRAGVHPWISS